MISVSHLNKFYNRGKSNEIHVLNDISLDLPDKGIVAIFGPSGCGKTTLLNVIGGLDNAGSGEVRIDDSLMSVNDAVVRNKEIGVIFQNYSLNRDETVAENVSDALRLCGMDDEEEIAKRVTAALTGVGMEKYCNRTPDTLSGGQQQRVAIARAIVKNPPVILADEPTGNLDEANTILVMDILKAMAKDRLVLLVTHEANLVDSYCDMAVELKDGSIVNIRKNENAVGYYAKKKNEIYLGELAKDDIGDANAELTFYGDTPGEPVKLTVVNQGGRIFLKVHTPKVTILDDASEVKLREGVFSEKKERERKQKDIDMSNLPPVEGKEYGRLFKFKNTLKRGFTSNYRSMMQRKSKKRLSACLALFGAAIVFLTAYCSTGIRQRIELREQYNNNVFLLCAGNEDIAQRMIDAKNDPASGIEDFYLRSRIEPTKIGEDSAKFRMALFDTAGVYEGGFKSNLAVECPVTFLTEESLSGKNTVAGETKDLKDNEAVITTNVADRILRDVPYEFMKTYENVIGMLLKYEIGDQMFTVYVKGVVEDEQPTAYLASRTLDYISLYSMFGAFNNVVDDRFGFYGLQPGECMVVKLRATRGGYESVDYYGSQYAEDHDSDNDPEIAVGDELVINDVALRVKEFTSYDYPKQDDILVQCGYTSWKELTPEQESAVMDIYWNEYAMSALNRQQFGYSFAEYFDFEPGKDMPAWLDGMTKMIIVHPDDFHRISRTVGLTTRRATSYYKLVEEPVDFKTVLKYSPRLYDFDTVFYQVYSNDPEKTEAYLREHFSDVSKQTRGVMYEDPDFPSQAIYTPQDRFDRSFVSLSDNIIQLFFVWIGVIVLMCISMYFIMRSTVMSRMREIGIYRSIGASRKNVVFRFAVETGIVVTFSVMLGYLAASAVVWYILKSGGSATTWLYYPLWMALLIIVLLYAICIPCGILPVLRLIRKTPSEIMAKYDI